MLLKLTKISVKMQIKVRNTKIEVQTEAFIGLYYIFATKTCLFQVENASPLPAIRQTEKSMHYLQVAHCFLKALAFEVLKTMI